MMDPLRMQREHARLDAVPAEEAPPMVEENFVVVHVPMVERDVQRLRIALQRARDERRDEQAPSLKGHMHAGWQVIARAHDRREIAHVELGYPEIALPSDHVHGMKGVDDARVLAVALDVNFPLASFAIGGGSRLRGRQHPTIKLRMLAQQASFGQLDRLWGFDDEQEHRTRLDDDAIGCALGDRKSTRLNSSHGY